MATMQKRKKEVHPFPIRVWIEFNFKVWYIIPYFVFVPDRIKYLEIKILFLRIHFGISKIIYEL